jgi:hypothetical protein
MCTRLVEEMGKKKRVGEREREREREREALYPIYLYHCKNL